jgi:hypothetical protein
MQSARSPDTHTDSDDNPVADTKHHGHSGKVNDPLWQPYELSSKSVAYYSGSAGRAVADADPG